MLSLAWLTKPYIQIILGVSFSVGLGWLAVRGLEWESVIGEFKNFPIRHLIAAFLVFLASRVLLAYRWQILFLDEKISLLRLFLVQNAGVRLNNLVPVRVISEATQFILLTLKYKVKAGNSLATLGIERVLDLVSSASVLLVGVLLIPSSSDFAPYVGGAVILASISVVLVQLFIGLSSKPFVKRIPWLNSIGYSVVELTRAKKRLATSLLLSIIYWLGIGVVTWILANGMELRTSSGQIISPIIATVTIVATLYFTTAVPAMPAAVGTFEFAMKSILALFGVSSELAFSYALLIHAILFIPPVLITIFVLPFTGFRSIIKGILLGEFSNQLRETLHADATHRDSESS